jgi:hypothetical protein
LDWEIQLRHRRSRIRLRTKLVTVGGVGLASLIAASAAVASTGSSSPSPVELPPGSAAPAAIAPQGPSATALGLPAGTQACAVPLSLNQMHCDLFVGHGKAHSSALRHQLNVAKPATSSVSIINSLGPADLRAAYNLTTASTSDGNGVTVAIVDAYGDPSIATDLAQYRSNWSLPACNTSTGAGCLTVLNQAGASSPLPAAPTAASGNLTWEDEQALDVEMVSAICPNCHIDLFQANTANVGDLGTAENSAAKVSKFISNSWSGLDYPGESALDNVYFNHPGVVAAFASGDTTPGQPEYPTSSGLVTAVGGTYLQNDSTGTGYTESVWDGQSTGSATGTGSGCSSGEGKPSWQTDTGCGNRTENDVAAVADAPFGIDTYSSSGDCNSDGAYAEANDCASYGTSVATPIITAIYALAGTPEANTYPSSYLYQPGHAAGLNDVTSGHVGSCESTRLYLCTAEKGYDGPTGWGTPNGTAAFASTVTGDIVSVDNPGTYDLQAGIKYSLPAIRAYDSASGHTLTYSATGLPAGLAINSGNGAISGTISATPANAKVKVTVSDGNGGSATISFGIVSVKSLLGSYHAGTGQVQTAPNGSSVRCVNDTRNSTANGTPVDLYGCENVASETGWSYTPSGAPGLPNTVNIHGRCMYASGNPIRAGAKVGLYQCNSAASEKWYLAGYGEIVQASSGLCLTDPGSSLANNTQLTVTYCTDGYSQQFVMPASPVTSGIAGKCLAVSAGHAASVTCAVTSSQEVTLAPDGTLRIGGKCLYKTGSSYNNGTAVGTYTCLSYPATGWETEQWAITAYGQIENQQSEKCLAVPNNSTGNGAYLAIEDCTGQPGEVWAVS